MKREHRDGDTSPDWKNGRNIFHIACCFGNVEEVEKLLSEETNPEGVLSEMDKSKWSPLHYVCRYRPRDEKLIKFLLDNCPKIILKCDIFGRYPLHIACDSMPSKEVVQLLLDFECSFPDKDETNVILKLTKNLMVSQFQLCVLKKTTH